MNSLSDSNIEVEQAVPLAPFTSFGLGGPARYFARVDSAKAVFDALEVAVNEGLPALVLGGGTNLLVADEGVNAVVLKPEGGSFESIEVHDRLVIAGGGVPTSRVMKVAADAGLSGLEGLAGLPGTIGGAARVNAGGCGAWISHCISCLSEVGDVDGEGGVIVTVEMQLEKSTPEAVREEMARAIEKRRSTQPMGERSAGCIFRNPPGGDPAGMVIDELGLKGESVGAAVVSDLHANWIVAREGCTAADVFELIDVVAGRVRDERGINLIPEIEIWR